MRSRVHFQFKQGHFTMPWLHKHLHNDLASGVRGLQPRIGCIRLMHYEIYHLGSFFIYYPNCNKHSKFQKLMTIN